MLRSRAVADPHPERVVAVVVTHDRRDQLAECLDAVLGGSRVPDAVVVVDNASSDGTSAMLAERFPGVEVLGLPDNSGSAGGYAAGIDRAAARGPDWIWLLDDDTVVAGDALEQLLRASRALADSAPALLASKVLWTDGRLHPMNYSTPRLRPMDDFVAGVERGVVEIRYTTWVSLLARRTAIERVGLPRAHYFVWSDDIEWTARVLREARGYLVPGSVAVHKTRTAHIAPQMGDRFYYAVRNGLFLLRSRAALTWREKLLHSLAIAEQVRAYLVANRLRPRALRVVGRGVAHGLTRRAE